MRPSRQVACRVRDHHRIRLRDGLEPRGHREGRAGDIVVTGIGVTLVDQGHRCRDSDSDMQIGAAFVRADAPAGVDDFEPGSDRQRCRVLGVYFGRKQSNAAITDLDLDGTRA